ncbi:NAD-dependent epimerase/dehydratase family protein [Dyadobacter sp. CY323]|uniref:NAD-dependent epimerase/dehydratase family protein n=1 Tax=Dyadobacter sp. CY323 TaxID=2907302 RepID=UPI001F2D4059|nr:NAD-dependent epimerase/dehydratase family protein [Dyadobacter sp. CY323]MCE6992761.1 NAD-dependent epimerase/dehydratase family protein [Dyadobacter sp. CY323]
MKVLVTGSAGFIGFHTVKKLLEDGLEVVGLDNINDYYSPQLKYARLAELGISQTDIKWYNFAPSTKYAALSFFRANLEDKQQLFALFQKQKFDYVINLAAQAGVRYSIENPDVYIQSNILGFHYILEACRTFPVKHLVHASSSSVYGENGKVPFSESDQVDSPVSLYAATKKSNELTAHAYSQLYNIPITCLRFFTVYGPWGRPDMAPMLFAKAISEGMGIKVFNNGDMQRDFTYVGDIVKGVVKTMLADFESGQQYRVLNIGNGSPVNLMNFIKQMEVSFGKEALKNFLPKQPGDVYQTYADTSELERSVGYKPMVGLSEGISDFVEWYTSEKNPLK